MAACYDRHACSDYTRPLPIPSSPGLVPQQTDSSSHRSDNRTLICILTEHMHEVVVVAVVVMVAIVVVIVMVVVMVLVVVVVVNV